MTRSDEENKRLEDHEEPGKNEEKSFLKIIVHSFFIIPFLIAVFCLLLFTSMKLLTEERKDVYDYLEDVKIGGLTKRWQGAFELSKIIANAQIVDDGRFTNELISAFENAKHDDNRVRQYLALAMGRYGRPEFLSVLLDAIDKEKEENLPAIIYSLGMLRQPKAADNLHNYLTHPDSRIRSITTVALGTIANPESVPYLEKNLKDTEENVQWGAAVSLAHMGSAAGKGVLQKMLKRTYFADFPEVDNQEKNHLMLAAIQAAAKINDEDLNQQIKKLAQNDPNMKVRAAALAVITK